MKPIQLYGSSHTTIVGNYFHDNSTGLMIGSLDTDSVVDNVFVTDGEYPDQIVLWACGDKHNAIRHNTLANGASIRFISDGCSSSVYETVYDNVVTGSVHADRGLSMTTARIGYNLVSTSLGGTNNVVGLPLYVGGAHPRTRAGFQLAAGSTGKGMASDGKDIGILR